jgi:hypothetical protein
MKRAKQTAISRKRIALPLAIVGYALMIVGLVSVVIWGTGVVRSILDNTAARTKYENLVGPIVMMDPIPSEDVSEADSDFVLEASLWSALTGENRGNYSYDDFGMTLVPATDVSVAATRLFGPDVTLEHRTFEDNDGTYLYDPEIAAYRVPSLSKVAYSASVTNIEKQGDTVVLTVGYVAPGNMWSTEIQGNSDDPTPEKYMYYILTKGTTDDYYVSAVRDIEPTLS